MPFFSLWHFRLINVLSHLKILYTPKKCFVDWNLRVISHDLSIGAGGKSQNI